MMASRVVLCCGLPFGWVGACCPQGPHLSALPVGTYDAVVLEPELAILGTDRVTVTITDNQVTFSYVTFDGEEQVALYNIVGDPKHY